MNYALVAERDDSEPGRSTYRYFFRARDLRALLAQSQDDDDAVFIRRRTTGHPYLEMEDA